METIELSWFDPVDEPAGVVALGSFDGLTREDMRVIETAQDIAASNGLRSSVLLFEPHPRRLLRPTDPPFSLMTTEQRHRRLLAQGIDRLYLGMFSPQISQISPDAFVTQIVRETLRASYVCASSRIQFGHNEHDRKAFLKALFDVYGSSFIQVETGDSRTQSLAGSSIIRRSLQTGNVLAATHHLGRSFAIEGPVMHGAKLGRTIGFPTANIPLGEYIRPAFGIYASYTRFADGRRLPSVSYIGRRPTVNGTEELLEVFLFDFNENIYGQTIETEFIEFIRKDETFNGLEELTQRIALDCNAARRILGCQ